MQDFETLLLREKFTIKENKISYDGKPAATLVAMSNRMVVPLVTGNASQRAETFIVRGQNMHMVACFAARIIKDFEAGGPIMSRAVPYEWEKVWKSIVNDYEYAYNSARWIAIYHEGKVVFDDGDRNPFLDMIEKCEHTNNKDYDYAIPMAEQLLKKANKDMKISYDANAALNVDFGPEEGRCGIILRGSNKTTTFSFSFRKKEGGPKLNIAHALSTAAAFLEGVQLSFLVGFNVVKIEYGIIERFSKEEKQTREGGERLGRLKNEINNFEAAFQVRYRPEKPDLTLLLNDASELAYRVLEPVPEPEPEPEADQGGEDGEPTVQEEGLKDQAAKGE
ncbi:MAG: hypothetical protein KTR28_06230 [Micavibrio sp.]|nr:hypothetical protein [Micavibrio sp.]